MDTHVPVHYSVRAVPHLGPEYYETVPILVRQGDDDFLKTGLAETIRYRLFPLILALCPSHTFQPIRICTLVLAIGSGFEPGTNFAVESREPKAVRRENYTLPRSFEGSGHLQFPMRVSKE